MQPTDAEAPQRPIAVRLTGVSKHFGGVRALDDVHLEVLGGEIHALLGENGAGKSTILKILNGVHAPTAGTIEVNGATPNRAHARCRKTRRHRHDLSGDELGAHAKRRAKHFPQQRDEDSLGLIDDASAAKRARALFATLGVDIDPLALVGDLSAGQRQLTEIVKQFRAM